VVGAGVGSGVVGAGVGSGVVGAGVGSGVVGAGVGSGVDSAAFRVHWAKRVSLAENGNEAPSKYSTLPSELVDHPAKEYPGLSNPLPVRAVRLDAVWLDIVPAPPFALKVTVWESAGF
jgi:hypothetical protein